MAHEEIEDKKLTVQEEREQYGTEKPKAKNTARLIWASKPRKEPSAKDLEFQTAEEVYPNIADKETHKLSAYTETSKDISKQPKQWRYVLLPQDVYKEMEGQSLRAIISRCESYLMNLKIAQGQ